MAQAPERVPSWYVFDSREDGRLPAIAMPEGVPADHLAAGTWVTAPSIGELASAMGVPPSALEETVSRFNGFCAAGVDDDFGRGVDEYDTFFGGGLVGVDQPPYYAARFVLSDLGTKGGLLTDAAGRVLREDGSVIAGLYASSNTTASMFGSVYPGPGAPLGSAMVMASLAVQAMISG
jgi:3-oxosteroid 1-dehydrogenase